MKAEVKKPEPVWCVVANVVYERNYGPGGLEKRRGTKHFAAGAKVYCVQFFWDGGDDNVEVVGRHRGSQRYVKMVIRTEWLTNYRVELVYSPAVIRGLTNYAYRWLVFDDKGQPLIHNGRYVGTDGISWDGSEASKKKCEELVARLNAYGAKTQPFVTRPPSGEQSGAT
jgi:hypothetical protein